MNAEVLDEELDGFFVIRDDATDLGGGDHDDRRAVTVVKIAHGGGVLQVEFGAGGGEEISQSLGLESADDGAADHAAVPGDVNWLVFQHPRNISRDTVAVKTN